MAEANNMDENFEVLLAQHEAHSEKLRKGQKTGGKIIAISGDDVFVDVGLKEDGIMDRSEILDKDGNETVGVGGHVEAYVIDISSQGIKLSRSMSGSGVAALEDAMAAALPVAGRVKGQCKGGYQVDVLGKTAFCPGSQMEWADNPEELVGRQMEFLVTKIENHGRNIVVSRRALIERERKESLDNLLASLNVGDIVEGRVSRLAPFGAFVELAPQVEGMAHVSELSWSRVSSPEEAVSVDDIITVKVTAIGTDGKGQPRISLSRKQALADPWQDIEGRFKPGDVVEGRIARLAPFGAFVEIATGIEGLVHLSEMSWEKRVAKPEEIVAPGDVVQVAIREVNPETRRISLSLRDALGDPWQDAAEKLAPGTVVSGTVESRTPHGLFVRLAPGITGLLPASAQKNAKNQAEFAKLASGDSVNLVVQSIDVNAKRISLAPVGSEDSGAADANWRQHVKSAPDGDNMGIMAQALHKAMQKKEKGDKNA